jgi:hypothetical protein
MKKIKLLYTGPVALAFPGVGKIQPAINASPVEFEVVESLAMNLARDPYIAIAPVFKFRIEPVPLIPDEPEKTKKKKEKGGDA